MESACVVKRLLGGGGMREKVLSHRLMIQHDIGSVTLHASHLTEADFKISPGLHRLELYEQSQVLRSAPIIQHSGIIPSLIVSRYIFRGNHSSRPVTVPEGQMHINVITLC